MLTKVWPRLGKLLSGFMLFSIAMYSPAQITIKLAAAEQEPYAGKNLPNRGYVNELVSAAFARVGIKTEVSFYPLARAIALAEQGTVEGVMPLHLDESDASRFYFSEPFPGDNLGLLKKKSISAQPYASEPSTEATLRKLQAHKFGLVRGTSVNPEFDNATYLDKQFVSKEIQLLDMLSAQRFDFAVIDQYTAADLMINERPHLLGTLEYLRPPLASQAFHIAFSKQSHRVAKVVAAFNRGLIALQQEGEVQRILAKHGLLSSRKSREGKSVLTIGAIDTVEIRTMQALSQEFEAKHPQLTLDWRILDENTLRKRLLADIAISEGAFDIMMIGAYEAPIWGRNGWLIPLRNIPEDYDLDDITASARDGLAHHGSLYALPFYVESTMTFYRKDLFEKAGISMPPNPEYDDILQLASKVHDPDNGVYGIGLRGKDGWGQNMAFITILVNTFGGRWFDENWKPKIDSPQWRKALTYYKDILARFGHPDYASNGWYENQQLFAEGKLAIVIDATSFAGRLFNPDTSTVHNKIGIAAAPTGRYPPGARWLWSWSLAIPVSTKLPSAAQDFVLWATSKDYIRRVAATQGWVSVPPGSRLSTYGEEYRANAPFADFVIREIQQVDPNKFTEQDVPYTGPQFVAIPEFPAIGNQVGFKMNQYLKGELSLDEALQQAQRQVETIMRQAGY